MKVLTTPRSYGKTDPAVFDMLAEKGIEVVKNETGGILDKETMIRMLADCDGLIVGVDPVDAEVIASAPKLRAIAKYGVGVDNIDLEAVLIDRTCRTGSWKKISTIDVSHATLGILGLGAIGKNVAKRAQGFDMNVLAYDVFWDEAYAAEHHITKATPEEIFRQSDFISVHLPLMPETENFIAKEQLAMMKPNVILVNTARGGLIHEADLLDALEAGTIYGAGIDAFCEEPPKDERWFTLDNVVIGSHCAASTVGASRNMGRMATANLIRDLGL